jgi:hypothetical protein
MAQPTPYVKATNFQEEEADNVAGRSTVRTAMVDAELAAIELTLEETLANLAVIQRDDTGLQDLIVTTESLSANVKALFAGGINPRGTWLTTTSYAVKDVVETGTPFVSYICVIAHTSGVFATDRSAGKWMVLGQEPGSIVITDLTLTTGGIVLSTNNTQDLAATANRFRSGYFGTSVFASTSVVTPLVGTITATPLVFQYNGAAIFQSDNVNFRPSADLGIQLGFPTFRWSAVLTPTLDSGTAGSLSLKTGNGTSGFEVIHRASGVTRWRAVPGLTANEPILEAAGETNTSGLFDAFGTGGFKFRTDSTGSGVGALTAFEIVRVASANRWLKAIPSNGGNVTLDVTAGSLAITPALVLANSIFLGDSSNAFNSLGLTINQAGADSEIISLKSSDVAHGVTANTETDTFGVMSKLSGTAGGLMLQGFSSDNRGIRLDGIVTNASTTKSVAGQAAATINGYLKSGVSVTSLGADSNILAVMDSNTTRFILDADGDSHQDVGTAWTNFDEHDDVALLDAIAVAVSRPGDPLRNAFMAELESKRAQLERLPGKAIVTFNDDGHHFVNMSRLVMLQHGAIRQLANRLSTMERKLLQ